MYVTGGPSAAQDNALAGVAYANDTQVYFTYDADGRLIDQQENGGADDTTVAYLAPAGYVTTDGDGNQTTIYFNMFGAAAESIDPLGNVTRAYYDNNLNLTKLVGPGGVTYSYTYNQNGDLVSETDPLGLVTSFTYNSHNNLTSYTDAKGNTTNYEYDLSNDLLSITYANGTSQQYGYNPLGEATQFVNANGQSIGSTYNAQGLVATETFADGTSYSYTYDAQGNLTSATDAQGNVTAFVYGDSNNPNLLTEVEYPEGTWLEFSYNAVGQRTESVDQTGFTTNYAYDALGRLSELTDGNGNLIVQYTYDNAGNLIQKNNGNGTFTVYTYDGDGDVLTITNYAPSTGGTNFISTNSTVNSYDNYTYDALGNVLTDSNQDGEWVYTYDADSQLTQAVFTPNADDPDGLTSQNLQYVYDAAGNRESETVNGVTTTYVTNNVNEYTSTTTDGLTTTYQYDADGNLIGQSVGGSTTTYTFNELNELTAVNGPGLTASYGYDPLGNLVSQTVNGAATTFQIDPAGVGNVVATFGTGDTLTAHYTYGLELVSQVSAAGIAAYYDFNSIGSTVGISGSGGNYINAYAYAPFGKVITFAAGTPNPFAGAGMFGAQTVSQSLTVMGARVYNADLGRFVSRDPLGLPGGDQNLYRFVDNNPINYVDPSGFFSVSVVITISNSPKTGNPDFGSTKVGVGGANPTGINETTRDTEIDDAIAIAKNAAAQTAPGQAVSNALDGAADAAATSAQNALNAIGIHTGGGSSSATDTNTDNSGNSGNGSAAPFNNLGPNDPYNPLTQPTTPPNPSGGSGGGSSSGGGSGGGGSGGSGSGGIGSGGGGSGGSGSGGGGSGGVGSGGGGSGGGGSGGGGSGGGGSGGGGSGGGGSGGGGSGGGGSGGGGSGGGGASGGGDDIIGGPCTDAVSGSYYYICGGNDVTSDVESPISIPGRDCSAESVEDSLYNLLVGGGELGAILTGAGGGVISPAVVSTANCNPVDNEVETETDDAESDASDPPINTSPAVAGTDQAANAVGSSGNTSPLTFIATALGNLGLISGQGGNDGNTSSIAAQMVSTIATFDQVESDIAGILSTTLAQGGSLGIAGDIVLLQQVDGRIEAVTGAENLLFGGDANWLDTDQSATLQQWMMAFFTDAQGSSGGSGAITTAEMRQLLATALPSSVSTGEATEFLDRWNQTVQYWSEGIFTADQVPAGQSTDFLDLSAIQTAFNTAMNAELQSQANGYSDVGTEVQGALKQVQSDLAGQATCATIKLQIDQSATLTRSAFSGTLTITNSEGTGAMTDVTMDINITDTEGNPANGEFFVSSPIYSGAFSVIDGVATLPDYSSGSISFTFIPDNSAAANGPTQYNIGGTVGFTDPSGGAVTIPVFPSIITVDPQPELQLNYFLQTDVIGTDPFTPQDVIPSEPATLGLLVTNVGGGTANNLSITSAQPQVVQNAKGLLDTIQIVGTQVGNQQETPSLTADFGDIAPGQTADASFLIESSLEGSFENFSATFSQSDALGGAATSLITSVVTHTLVHAGDFNYSDSTGATDYLVDDNPNPEGLPDTIYFSDGTTAAVNIATDAASSPVGSSSALTFQVTANVTSGWNYIQLPDPGAGYTLYEVVRSDGEVIPVSDQAWTTDRTISPTGASTVDYELHILDDNSTGSYLVYYRPATATAPTVASISSVPSPQSGPIGSVDITFSEPIDPSTLTTQNLSLTLNGEPNLINSAVTITQNSPTDFTIGGFSALTAADGNYTFTVNTAGISDFFGDVATTGSLLTSWANGTNVPVIVSVGAGSPSLVNAPVDTVDVVLSEPIEPASFDYNSLTLAFNGGPNLITSGVTVTQINPTTYQIGGLAALTAADGDYELTVSAAGLVDGSGNAGVGFLSGTWTMSTVGPTIAALPTYIQSPRNIIVPSIDVVFSEPIVPSTFTYQNITYSQQGGPNLITPGITITELSPTEFEISDFNNLIYPIDGAYTFTVSAAGVMDLYGNTGIGSASASWVLDTTAAAAPANLAITPNTSATPGVTDTGSVTLTGTLSEPGLSVDVTNGNTDLGFATVSGTTFSMALNLPAGESTLEVTATDAAGNVSPESTFNVFVDATAFGIVSMTAPTPDPTNTPVSAIDVAFTAPVNLSTFTTANLTLTDNGGPNLVTSAVTISLISGSTYLIGGLAGLTTAEGAYVLTVNAAGIQGPSGNAAGGSLSTSWLMDTTPPTSSVPTLPAQTTSTAITVAVSGSDPAGSNDSTPSGIASYAIFVSTNGGTFTYWRTVTPANPSVVFVGQAGNSYGFYSVSTDNAGNVQPTPTGAQQTVEILPALTVTTITPASPNPTNTPVSTLDVTFSVPLGAINLTAGGLRLTDNGGPNLITSAVSLTPVSGTTSTYAITGLAGLTTVEGTYNLTVDAAAIDDEYGNPGTGTSSTSWSMDTTPPTSTVNSLPSQTTGTSFNVLVTASDPPGANGSAPSGIASIGIYVSENGGAYSLYATVTPADLSVLFIGQTGNSYGFYSVATDNAGNVQPTPASAQTTIQIVSPLSLSAIVAQQPAGVVAGTLFCLTIDVVDAQNQIDTSYNGSVTVSFANNPGGSALGGLLTVNAVNGVATFSGLTISNPGLSYALQVSATGANKITTANFDVAGYELVTGGPNENLAWFGTTGSDQVQFTQTGTNTVQITLTELAGVATSYTVTVTGVTGNVVVNEYDVAGDADIVDGSSLTTISSVITVGDGNDTLIGGGGANTIVAGNGNDFIYGNGVGNSPNAQGIADPSNTITVGNGKNTIYGNYSWSGYEGGNNTITAGDGNNIIYGNYGYGDYQIDGAEGGNNTIKVGDGNNTIYGNFGNADGGEGGNNTITAGDGNDVIFGNGAGDDPNRKGGNNFIQVGNGSDTIYGNFGGDGGEGGNNTILTGSGRDTIYGNFGGDGGIGGNNLIVAGGGNDTIYAHCALPASGTTVGTTTQGLDLIIGGSGADTVYGWPAGYTLGANTGDLFVAGTTNLTLGALDAMLAEWVSSDDYATRLADLNGNNGTVGANGGNFLISGTTVIGSTAVDQIFGTMGSDEDWYLITSSDDLNDVDPNDVTLLE